MVTKSIEYNGDERTATEVVISSVADAKGISYSDLDQPLYETVDTEALNELLKPAQTRSETSIERVEFTYCGFRIRLDDTTVTITNASE